MHVKNIPVLAGIAVCLFGGLWAMTSADAVGQATKPAGQDAVAEARERLRRETEQVLTVFRGTVDIYLTAKGAEQPAFSGAEIHGLDRVGDYAYYTVKPKEGGLVRIPPGQILMVRLTK